MFDILYNPLDVISNAKQDKNIGKTFMMLAIAAIIIALLAYLTLALNVSDFGIEASEEKTPASLISLIVFIIIFASTIIMAFLYQIVLNILTEKGSFFDALTPVVYGLFIFGCGAILIYAVSYIPHIWTALVLGGIILILTIMLSISVCLKAFMELFETNLLTIIVSFLIVFIAISIIAFLISFMIGIDYISSLLPSIPTG